MIRSGQRVRVVSYSNPNEWNPVGQEGTVRDRFECDEHCHGSYAGQTFYGVVLDSGDSPLGGGFGIFLSNELEVLA